MKNILNKALIIVGIITALVIIIILILSSQKESAITALKNSFNNQISTIGTLVNGYELDNLTSILSKNQTTLSLEAKVDTDIADLEALNEYNIKLKLSSDKLNEHNIFNLIINDDKDELNLSFYLLRSNSYLYLKDTYSKYIDLGSNIEGIGNTGEYINSVSSYNEDDINYLLNLISGSIIKSISEKDLTISKSNEKIYGKSLDLKVIALTIDNAKYETITSNISNDLIDDEKALNILALMMDKTTDEVKDSIREIPDFDGKDELKIYVDSNYNLVKISSELKADIDDVPTKNTMEYICSAEKYTFNYKNLIGSDETTLVFDNSKKDKKITYNTSNKDVDKNVTKNNGKIVFSTLNEEDSYNLNISFENTQEDESGSQYLNLDLSIKATNTMELTVPTISPIDAITLDEVFNDPTFTTAIQNNSILSQIIGLGY